MTITTIGRSVSGGGRKDEKQNGDITPVVSAVKNAQAVTPSTGSAGGGKAVTGGVASSRPAQAAEQPSWGYDPNSDMAYQTAMSALNQVNQNKPEYAGTYDGQLKDLYDQIVGREKFSYDVNADALYQQYKDNYIQQGRMAMMDTMGQAAALTGGYGNSYAQSVGQQAYNGYLQQLNDIIPELYDRAYAMYQDEGDRLMQQFGMLGDLDDREYSRYRDKYGDYLTERDYLTGRADTTYDRGYQSWADILAEQHRNDDIARDEQHRTEDIALQREQIDYQKRQDSLSVLARGGETALAAGQKPTGPQLQAMGITEKQAERIIAGIGTGNSNNSSNNSSTKTTKTSKTTKPANYDAETAAMQKKLNGMGAKLDVDGVWGPATQAAYDKYVGGGADEIPDNATIANRHGDSWITIGENGRYSYQELEQMVNSGKVKETYNAKTNTVTYTFA